MGQRSFSTSTLSSWASTRPDTWPPRSCWRTSSVGNQRQERAAKRARKPRGPTMLRSWRCFTAFPPALPQTWGPCVGRLGSTHTRRSGDATLLCLNTSALCSPVSAGVSAALSGVSSPSRQNVERKNFHLPSADGTGDIRVASAVSRGVALRCAREVSTRKTC